MFSKKKVTDPATESDTIISAVLSSFKYEAHLWRQSKISEERKVELLNPEKPESKKPANRELAYLKAEIAEEFVNNVNALKGQSLEPQELISRIETLIAGYVKMSRNIRAYQEEYNTPGGYQFVHGYESEWVEGTSGKRTMYSHEEGELEKNFAKASKALSDIQLHLSDEEHSSYKLQKPL